MSMKTITLVGVSGTETEHATPIALLHRVRAGAREICRAALELARERRRARINATALERLGPRELRDVGLVRLHDVYPARYMRIRDL